MEKIAAIRIRGKWNIRKELEDTLVLLGLKTKNSMVVLDKTPSNLGMLKKVKDYITYGELNDETLKKLSSNKDPKSKTEKKTVFTLPNPKKGFKNIKVGFSQKGDLGYRGEKINELIERIIENIEKPK